MTPTLDKTFPSNHWEKKSLIFHAPNDYEDNPYEEDVDFVIRPLETIPLIKGYFESNVEKLLVKVDRYIFENFLEIVMRFAVEWKEATSKCNNGDNNRTFAIMRQHIGLTLTGICLISLLITFYF